MRSRATYRQVIGVEPGNLQIASPVDRLLPRRIIDAIEIARARHPSVGVAMFGIDAAVLQVKINEGTLYPKANLVGTVQQFWEVNNTSNLQQFNAFLQGQLTIPLYQWGGGDIRRFGKRRKRSAKSASTLIRPATRLRPMW